MCGIAGIALADPNGQVDRARLAAMSLAILHRGPDGEGTFCAPGVGLAHRRLSIIDLEGGTQPIGNEDGSIQVVFNGEIYNYRELRADLEQKGHRFATNSDTEVLVHLYEELGDRFVQKLRGMFAIALWDAPARRLVLARDRVGIKPLYFCRDKDRLLFGSELKTLLAYGDVPRDLDLAALEDYLGYGMVAGTRTIFRGMEKLAAGHVLVIDADHWNAEPRCYWQLDFSADEFRNEAEWIEAVQAKVRESVQKHLIADVPVGAFLSGGLDSSIITAIASQQLDRPLRTFSIGFDDKQISELPLARLVSHQYGTQHTEEVVSADAVQLLDELCWHFDEPFADTSAIPTLLVSRLASQQVKVVLSGDGGDEAFGGYARYPHDLRESQVRNLLPHWFRKRVLQPIANAWPQADQLPRWLRAKSTLTNISLDAAAAYANTLAQCRGSKRRELLTSDAVRSLNGHRPEALFQHAFRSGSSDALSRMIATDVATLLPDDFLVKVDRASMACGLEVRPPLLDHELLELTAAMPSRFKVRGGQTKWILRKALGNLLPPPLLTKPKQGFEVPVDAWLRGSVGDLFRETALDKNSPVASILDLSVVQGLFERHQAGRQRNGQALWSILVLTKWAERFMKLASV